MTMLPAAPKRCPVKAWRRARADRTDAPAPSGGLTAAPSHATQLISGAGKESTLIGRRRLGGPALGENFCGIADQMRRAEAGCFERLRDRRDARPDQRTAVAADHLEIDLIVAGIDRRDHRMLAALADHGRGIGRQRGDADRYLVSRERNAARRREADAQSGEAAGSGGHRDAVERGKRQRGLLHHARDQRHQRFGVPALHRLRFHRDQSVGAGVEHGGGAGVERGIDGKDQHGGRLSIARAEKRATPQSRG